MSFKPANTPRLFWLDRLDDESGVSGTGLVLWGVQFSDGQVVVQWDTEFRSVGIYKDIQDFTRIHGHMGKSIVRWMEP